MEPVIRHAEPADRTVIERIVRDAYLRYVARIGRAPAPMNDDYQARIAEGVVRVLTIRDEVAGLVVLLPKADYLLPDNVPVHPQRQDSSFALHLFPFPD